MGHNTGEESTRRPEEPHTGQLLDASEVSELLRLLAFTREQAEDARANLVEAEARAEGESMTAASLRSEIDGMTSTVMALEAQSKAADEGLRDTERRIRDLETELKSAQKAIEMTELGVLETRAERDDLRAELDDVLGSTSWRFSAPLRAATGAISRRRAPESGNGTRR